MDLLSQQWIRQKHVRLRVARLVFYTLAVLFAAVYAFAFTGDSIWIPLCTGVGETIVLLIVYFALLYPNKKAVKFFDQIQSGLLQEETYVFLQKDGETERDGVPLWRLLVRTTGEEIYERTLYAPLDVPLPPLEKEQSFTGKTYQNILVHIKD